jgi:ATP-dependent Lon protease
LKEKFIHIYQHFLRNENAPEFKKQKLTYHELKLNLKRRNQNAKFISKSTKNFFLREKMNLIFQEISSCEKFAFEKMI